MTKRLHIADRLSLAPHYFARDVGAHADTLHELLSAHPCLANKLDSQGVQQFLDCDPDGLHTWLTEVAKVPDDHELFDGQSGLEIQPTSLPAPRSISLREVLRASLERWLANDGPWGLALSGGLDSAMVLALAEQIRPSATCIYTVKLPWDDGQELESALTTAHELGRDDVTVIAADEDTFVHKLRDTVLGAEVPLYNLYPVSRYLLAERLAQDGIRVVLTGDGADETFAGVCPKDYIPVIGSIFRSCGIRVRTPYLETETRAWAIHAGVDPNKTALRNAAQGLVSNRVISGCKKASLAPPIDLRHLARREVLQTMATESGQCIDSSNYRRECTWITLGMLVEHFREAFW